MDAKWEANAAHFVPSADYWGAVVLAYGQMAAGLSIAEARKLANDLARAADDAQAKAPK